MGVCYPTSHDQDINIQKRPGLHAHGGHLLIVGWGGGDERGRKTQDSSLCLRLRLRLRLLRIARGSPTLQIRLSFANEQLGNADVDSAFAGLYPTSWVRVRGPRRSATQV